MIVALYALRARRSPGARFLLVALAVAVVLDFGTGLFVKGRHELWLPWNEVAKLPVFDNVLTVRLSVFVALAGAAIVSIWTAGRSGWPGQLVLPGLAVLALVPAVWNHDFREHPERWNFFTSGGIKSCVPKNDNIAIFPFGVLDNSTLWQAESDFWFRMAEGYLAPNPPAASMKDPVVRSITYTAQDPTIPQILELVRDEKVDRIISIAPYSHPNSTQMHAFGALSVYDGVYIAPTCGYPSMQKGVHPTPPHPPKS